MSSYRPHRQAARGAPADDLPTQPEPVIFDLDGVLTRRDTLTALIIRGVVRRPWRSLAVVRPMWTVLRHRTDLARRGSAVGQIVSTVFTGVAKVEMDQTCVRVGRRAASSRTWTRPELVAQYRAERAAGHLVVVATATEERVAHALLDALSLEADLVLGSVITADGDAAQLGWYNYGHHKLRSLLEAGHPVDRSVFYTDSRSDLPVARAARRTILVAASAATLSAYRAAGVQAGSIACRR